MIIINESIFYLLKGDYITMPCYHLLHVLLKVGLQLVALCFLGLAQKKRAVEFEGSKGSG